MLINKRFRKKATQGLTLVEVSIALIISLIALTLSVFYVKEAAQIRDARILASQLTTLSQSIEDYMSYYYQAEHVMVAPPNNLFQYYSGEKAGDWQKHTYSYPSYTKSIDLQELKDKGVLSDAFPTKLSRYGKPVILIREKAMLANERNILEGMILFVSDPDNTSIDGQDTNDFSVPTIYGSEYGSLEELEALGYMQKRDDFFAHVARYYFEDSGVNSFNVTSSGGKFKIENEGFKRSGGVDTVYEWSISSPHKRYIATSSAKSFAYLFEDGSKAFFTRTISVPFEPIIRPITSNDRPRSRGKTNNHQYSSMFTVNAVACSMWGKDFQGKCGIPRGYNSPYGGLIFGGIINHNGYKVKSFNGNSNEEFGLFWTPIFNTDYIRFDWGTLGLYDYSLEARQLIDEGKGHQINDWSTWAANNMVEKKHYDRGFDYVEVSLYKEKAGRSSLPNDPIIYESNPIQVVRVPADQEKFTLYGSKAFFNRNIKLEFKPVLRQQYVLKNNIEHKSYTGDTMAKTVTVHIHNKLTTLYYYDIGFQGRQLPSVDADAPRFILSSYFRFKFVTVDNNGKAQLADLSHQIPKKCEQNKDHQRLQVSFLVERMDKSFNYAYEINRSGSVPTYQRVWDRVNDNYEKRLLKPLTVKIIGKTVVENSSIKHEKALVPLYYKIYDNGGLIIKESDNVFMEISNNNCHQSNSFTTHIGVLFYFEDENESIIANYSNEEEPIMGSKRMVLKMPWGSAHEFKVPDPNGNPLGAGETPTYVDFYLRMFEQTNPTIELDSSDKINKPWKSFWVPLSQWDAVEAHRSY